MDNIFKHDDLKKYVFFSKLTDNQLEIILQSSNIKTFRKEKAIFYQADNADIAYFILSGEVKRVKYRSDMTSMQISRLSSNSWIGLPEVITGGPYLYDAITIEESNLLIFPKSNLKSIMRIPEIQSEIIKELSHGYYSLHAHLDVYTSLQKLVRFLASKLNAIEDDNYELNFTQEFIAESIGVTRETVNKNLQFLQKKGLISLNRSKIIFTDKEKFLRFAEECL